MTYMVRGGIYTGTDFKTLVAGTEESYGPFQTREDAETVWSGKARANIDICCHRLEIVEQR